ncbi:MAG: RdgB/HAM1 family non-canonical purine NTP pyrophosphatase [Chitinophagaceae bacterium]
MFRLIFATNNQHKVSEIQLAIGEKIEVISLLQAGVNIDIPEPFDTLEANASEKAGVIHALTGQNCFSEDTGLEVSALNGEPGVKSARYAGDEKLFENNIAKLLKNLKDSSNRSARFRTVISLRWEGKEYLFDGICEGIIGYEPKGLKGFGYDSVFYPIGSNRSFAEMDMKEKTSFSHRKKAADKLVIFLQEGVKALKNY